MAKRTRYSVSKKYEVWVETEILAESFDDAVAKLKELEFKDFLETTPGTSLNDVTQMRGLGVYEV